MQKNGGERRATNPWGVKIEGTLGAPSGSSLKGSEGSVPGFKSPQGRPGGASDLPIDVTGRKAAQMPH